MTITAQQLLQILLHAGQKAGVFVPAVNAGMGKYAIVTRLRIAAFIAQIGHESGLLTLVPTSTFSAFSVRLLREVVGE